jgi:hypothetical protein
MSNNNRQHELIEMLLKQAGYKLEGKMWVNNQIKLAFGNDELFPKPIPSQQSGMNPLIEIDKILLKKADDLGIYVDFSDKEYSGDKEPPMDRIGFLIYVISKSEQSGIEKILLDALQKIAKKMIVNESDGTSMFPTLIRECKERVKIAREALTSYQSLPEGEQGESQDDDLVTEALDFYWRHIKERLRSNDLGDIEKKQLVLLESKLYKRITQTT